MCRCTLQVKKKKTLFKKRVTLNGVSFVTSTEKRQCMTANKIKKKKKETKRKKGKDES